MVQVSSRKHNYKYDFCIGVSILLQCKLSSKITSILHFHLLDVSLQPHARHILTFSDLTIAPNKLVILHVMTSTMSYSQAWIPTILSHITYYMLHPSSNSSINVDFLTKLSEELLARMLLPPLYGWVIPTLSTTATTFMLCYEARIFFFFILVSFQAQDLSYSHGCTLCCNTFICGCTKGVFIVQVLYIIYTNLCTIVSQHLGHVFA